MKNFMKNSFGGGVVIKGTACWYSVSSCTGQDDLSINIVSTVFGVSLVGYSVNRESADSKVTEKWLVGRRAKNIEEFCRWERVHLDEVEKGNSVYWTLT